MSKKTQNKKGKKASFVAQDKHGRMSTKASTGSALSMSTKTTRQKSSKHDPFKEFDIKNRKFSKPKRIDFFKGRSR